MSPLVKSALAVLALAACLSCGAQTSEGLVGDVGGALYRTPAITRTTERSNTVLPYLYADAGRWYARVDTFGVRMLPLGAGSLELAASVSFEAYRPANAAFDNRSTPLPVGVGSYQETPVGAFFLYAFRDLASGGTLLEATYAAELDAGPVHFYPQLGLERRSARYMQHLYGVGEAEAQRASLAAYAPGGSVTPGVALAMDYALTDLLKLSAQVRKRWLDASFTASPLVDARTQVTGFVALTRTFR